MKTTLTILLSIFVLQSIAQNNFQPGSIEKVSGETVNGFIDYRAWDRNPKSIRFREGENGSTVTYTVADLVAFQVSGKERYRKAIVVKDMRPVELHLVKSTTRDSTVTDTAFLRVVAEGNKLNLFELIDEKPHYFITDSTGNYQELVYKVYSTGNQQHVRNTFRDQLRQYIVNDVKTTRKLDVTEYEESDLVKIINQINGVSGGPALTGSTKTHGAKTVFFVSGGIGISSLQTSGLLKLEGMNYSNSITPAFSAGLDIVSNRNLGLLGIRFEALFTSSDFKGKSKVTSSGDELEREYSFKMTNITPSASFLLSPIRKPDLRVYVGIGIGYTFSSYSGNVFKEVNLTDDDEEEIKDFLELEKIWLCLPAQAGVNFKNFDLIFTTKILGNFERIINLKTSYSMYTARFAYRF